MEYLRLFVFLICVALMLHVTASSKSSKKTKTKESKKSSKKDCGGPPPTPTNGVVTGSNYLKGDVVTYSCKTGYVLEGETISTCQSRGTWDNLDSTTCRADCGPPTSPDNGAVIGSNYLQGDVVTYSCNSGYVLEGASTSTCQSDKIWNNIDSTTCRADCGPPTSPDNGAVIGSNYLQGDMVTYSCNSGYVLEGASTLTCQSDKIWNNIDSTTCRADCGRPTPPDYGVVIGSNYLDGDTVTYSCNSRYVLEGERTSTCQSNGTWDNLDSTTCRADCGRPPIPDNGDFDGSNYLEGDMITYICETGYVFKGDSTSTCQPDGMEWDIRDPICIADCGGLPKSPTNGEVNGSNYLDGDTVTYSCNSGYGLEGERTSTCQSNGTWDNLDLTTCRADCGPPKSPDYGVVIGSNYLDGDTVTYSCNSRYVLEGERTSTCQSNGIWDNLDSTKCRADCGRPHIPDNGDFLGSNYLEGDMITYICEHGYVFKGDSISTCQPDGMEWDIRDPICIAVCSSILQASTDPKTFVSHDSYGSSDYASNMDCSWVIEARHGYTIDFSFVKFELESHSLCLYDSVEVLNGNTETDPQLGKYCGSTVPGSISSNGRYLLVHFITDSGANYKGFSAEYKEGGPITP